MKTRYFTFHYKIPNINYEGMTHTEAIGFPNFKELKEMILKELNLALTTTLIIANIFEFKNKDDFENFTGKNN